MLPAAVLMLPAWGHFGVTWQKLWHKNDVFDEILGCSGHLTLPEKKWAPVAIKYSTSMVRGLM